MKNPIVRILLVDDEPQALQELYEGLRRLRPDWILEFADGGGRALQRLAHKTYDVVVSDFVMPRMSGLELLTKVGERYPRAVRVILSGYAEWKTGLQLMGPAHQYLAKPCDAASLEEVVARSLRLRNLLASETLQRIAGQAHALPSIPALYFELLRELGSKDPSADRIGAIISRDPSMTAKILKLANSAFFGFKHRMANPTEAVIYLGATTIQSLVLSHQIFSLFEPVTVESFSVERLWEHSWKTGTIARRIAERENLSAESVDHALAAGLLHDVGKLLLATRFAPQFHDAICLQQKCRLPLWQAEHEVFFASHADVGGYLLGLWGLPDPVVESVVCHHLPARSLISEFNPILAVYAANLITQDPPLEQWPPVDAENQEFLKHFNMPRRLEEWRNLAIAVDHDLT
jgi:HD-like signal output (HDOD) protein